MVVSHYIYGAAYQWVGGGRELRDGFRGGGGAVLDLWERRIDRSCVYDGIFAVGYCGRHDDATAERCADLFA